MSDWKCCGQMSDCYQCEQGPKPEAPTECELCGFSGHECDCPDVVAVPMPPKDSARDEWNWDCILNLTKQSGLGAITSRERSAVKALQIEYEKQLSRNDTNILMHKKIVEKLERELAKYKSLYEDEESGFEKQLIVERTHSAALVAALEYAEGQLLHAGYAKNAVPAIRKAIADYKGGE